MHGWNLITLQEFLGDANKKPSVTIPKPLAQLRIVGLFLLAIDNATSQNEIQ